MNRARIHRLLESADPADRTGRIAGCALAALILANVAALLLESTWPDDDALPAAFGRFEAISVAVFTVEYLLRLWSAPESPDFAGRFGRLRWICSPLALIDLLAITPALAGFVLPSTLDLRALRALRLMRILRILRLGRYSIAMQAIAEAVREKRSELASAVFVVLVMLVVASTLMFHVEHGQNGKSFPSIPAAMWWGIATLTTVGYGDVVPVTGLGKLLGAMIAILGIGVFALPAAILSSAFTERLSRHARPAAATRCPHCGKPLLADTAAGHDGEGEATPHR
ncbi:MAG: ion transporter [Planctomycetes bacterium]|nr:ion transporter [Planctomycetota bacterium]